MMHEISLDDPLDADEDWEDLAPSTASGDYGPPSDFTQHPSGYHHELSDAESDEEYNTAPRKRKDGYDSRIEQILCENPELPILIVDAGKSSESGGKYIVYTIRTGVSCFSHSYANTH
jgi:sorting nexin-41/42